MVSDSLAAQDVEQRSKAEGGCPNLCFRRIIFSPADHSATVFLKSHSVGEQSRNRTQRKYGRTQTDTCRRGHRYLLCIVSLLGKPAGTKPPSSVDWQSLRAPFRNSVDRSERDTVFSLIDTPHLKRNGSMPFRNTYLAHDHA